MKSNALRVTSKASATLRLEKFDPTGVDNFEKILQPNVLSKQNLDTMQEIMEGSSTLLPSFLYIPHSASFGSFDAFFIVEKFIYCV